MKKGSKMSNESKIKMSIAKKGNSYRKGKMHTEISKEKNRLSHLGKIAWNKGLMGYGIFNKGRKHTIESKKNMSEAHLGFVMPDCQKIKISEAKKGEKCHFWRGGISSTSYGEKWTPWLKTKIRKRDKFVCYVCKNNGYHVHHIDYNKENCEDDNLITLCKSCHMKTNGNREYWKEFLTNKLKKTL